MDGSTQSCTTVFSWDTEAVVRGVQEIEKAYDREGQARRRAKTTADHETSKARGSHGGHGGGHGPGDFGMGIHDALMGRTSAAMFRFANAAKMGAAAGVGMNVALEAGGRVMEYMQERIEETQKASERLEQSFGKLSKAATFSSAAEDPSKLLENRAGQLEGIKSEKEAMVEAERTQDVLQSEAFWESPGNRMGKGFGRYPFLFKEKWNEWQTGETTADRLQNMRTRQDVYGKGQAKLGREYHESLEATADIAGERAKGNTFEAQRKDLERRKTVEISVASSSPLGLDAKNKKLIEDRYARQKVLIDREERVARTRLETERAIASLRQRGVDVEKRGAQERLNEATQNLASPDVQAAGPESLVYQHAERDVEQRQADVAQIERHRTRALFGSAGQVDAARLTTLGRDDQAAVVSSRNQSAGEVYDLRMGGLDGEADDAERLQRERDRQALAAKYLNADGTRRNPGDVQREDVERQRRANRISAFLDGTKDTDPGGGLHTGGLDGAGSLESSASRHLAGLGADHDPALRLASARSPMFKGTGLNAPATRVGDLNLGLVGVRKGMDGQVIDARDALTGQTVNAQQIAKRATDAQADRERDAKGPHTQAEVFQGIYKILSDRLPKEVL